jgi:hypothetical protein
VYGALRPRTSRRVLRPIHSYCALPFWSSGFYPLRFGGLPGFIGPESSVLFRGLPSDAPFLETALALLAYGSESVALPSGNHKSQGSEFGVVIIPVLTQHFITFELWTSCMKLHNTRCHFQEVSHRRDRGDRKDYLKFSFSAFSAFSAVNCYVSFSIRPAVFWPAAGLNREPITLIHNIIK